MQKKQKSALLVSLALGVIVPDAYPAGDSDKARRAEMTAMKYCADCHGLDGNSVSPQFPRLAGQPRKYLELQMKSLRGQGRLNRESQDYMWGPMHHLDDETIGYIANYFSRQPPAPGGAMENAALGARGKQLFEAKPQSPDADSCANCHGQDAEGGGKAPRLAGQHRHYLIKQIRVVLAKERKVPDEMHVAIGMLSGADIEAIAEYLHAK